MNNLLAKYKNGNTFVKLYSDGTRVCTTEDDEFNYEYPLNVDMKISNKCSIECCQCHEMAHRYGAIAPLESFGFLKTFAKGTEIAVGGGALTEYEHLEDLLKMIKECGLIANCTFHQAEIIKHFDFIKRLQDQELIYGIGISFVSENDLLMKYVAQLKNVVFHVIAGMVTKENLEYLSKQNKPILILGYKKHTGRGAIQFAQFGLEINAGIKMLIERIPLVFKNFKTVSFDNLALEQLYIKSKLTEEQWNRFYQGEDGTCSMYIDAVKGEFAKMSTSVKRYPIMNNIKDMFEVVKNER